MTARESGLDVGDHAIEGIVLAALISLAIWILIGAAYVLLGGPLP